jgi:hypothetical protein
MKSRGSADERGTTFHVFLPQAAEGSARAANGSISPLRGPEVSHRNLFRRW